MFHFLFLKHYYGQQLGHFIPKVIAPLIFWNHIPNGCRIHYPTCFRNEIAEILIHGFIQRISNQLVILKNKVLIYETANSAAGMRKAAPGMAKLALKLMKGEEIGASCQEGYMPNGIRKNFFEKERGSKRAVDMLLKKLNGEHFVTEYPMPSFDRVAPNPAIKDLSKATIALCTSGGIVPKGNPDHIESSSASHYGEYSLDGFDKLSSADHETAHGGYDPVYANEDPNRVLPVDVMREFEREGKIGKLHNLYYATVGNGTAVASAKAFAAEYAQKLKKAGVDAVIMTST